MLIKIILLAVLVSWHTRTASGKALQFGGVYAGVLLIPGVMGLAAGGGLIPLAVYTIARFALASGYFWLLDQIHGLLGWLLTIVGALVLIFIF